MPTIPVVLNEEEARRVPSSLPRVIQAEISALRISQKAVERRSAKQQQMARDRVRLNPTRWVIA